MTRAARPRPRTCALGIMAYNEGRNIGRLLGALREETLVSCELQEIVVVASGCTDRTEELVAESARREQRLRLLRQAQREGQASAINLFLGAARASEADLCILMSADTLPQRGALEALVGPLLDSLEAGEAAGRIGVTPRVGMTGARIVPINGHDTVLGAAAEALSRLRHRAAPKTPRLRDLVAFLNVVESVPRDSAAAETSLLTAITAQGFRVRYVPESVALNRGAATLEEYLMQRRRRHAARIQARWGQGRAPSGPGLLMAGGYFLADTLRHPSHVMADATALSLEAAGRFLGLYDYHLAGRSYTTWEPATTTKDLGDTSDRKTPLHG